MPAKRQNAGPSTTQKRTRFAEQPAVSADVLNRDEGDAFLEEDLPESSSRIKSRERRKVKDTAGYGSDSSNDEDGIVPSRRPEEAKDEQDDEDVDMFADTAPEEKEDKAKGKADGQKKEFMDISEIEGQEFDRGEQRGETDEDTDEETDERAARLKRKENDLGFEVTPFNMKAEMEDGRFTADGEAYMENEKDEGDKHDAWLEDTDKDEIKKARKAHKDRERQEKERQEKELGLGEDEGERQKKEESMLREALHLMERGETVLEALQRLGTDEEDRRKREDGGKKKSWIERQKERKAASQASATGDGTDGNTPFARLTNIVSGLGALSSMDVYSLSRESIQRMLPAESRPHGSTNGASHSPAQPPDDRQFQYRFSIQYVRNIPEAQRPVEREVFGPFSTAQLRGWRNTGFFGGPACENVELRLIAGGAPGQWGSWNHVVEQEP